ncbi:MAG TPA: transcriptional repressor [Thermoanaerobaculia bacterium]|nr:transcriptional repressor [Thermoanaerobaculia bacterium]
MAAQREREQFLWFLRQRRLHVTGERLALFDEIYSQHRHIDAEELLAALRLAGRKISRATVYRTLDLLVECGLVRRQSLGRKLLYEHLHDGQQHDHLVCGGCGRVVEFVSPGITALQREICRAHGFSPDHHQLQILGLCLTCAEDRAARVAARHSTVEAAACSSP